MTAISPFTAVPEERHLSLLSSKKNSISDVDGMTESQLQARLEVPVTSGASADDSRGLPTPECDSIDLKVAAASRWASVQEALEACLDPFFLAGQASVKDDKIVEELTTLLDTSLTAHVPAVAGLAFLQPFFSGCTRSERLDAVLHAARVSNKLLLRDDLPVPSSSGWMLSVDEAEAASLRVGPRSHAEGVNRSLLSLERRHSGVDCDEAVRALSHAQLQATVPHHRIVKVERSEAPGVVRAVFVSPAAADRAYAVWRAHAPHADLRVTRVGGGATAAPPRPLPTPPRPASEARLATAAAAAAAAALRCPRIVDEAPLCPSSVDNASGLSGKASASSFAPAAAVPRVAMPKPPPAIDAALPAPPKPAASAAASSDPSTTSTTPSPENSTGKSKFNMNATPFLPKGVLEAQLAAAMPSAAGRWVRGSRPRRLPGCEDIVGSPIDTSEALANQMLMDSSTGWMYPALDAYNTPAWANKFTAVDGWAEAGMANACNEAAARQESPIMPARPTAVGGEMPIAPCALGDSPRMKELQPVGGVKGAARFDLYPPRPVTMSLPSEQAGSCAGYDGVGPAHASPLSQTSPATLSTSRRHRHDPYSPSGFVLCAESSCASSLSHPPGAASAVSPGSNRLLFAGSLTSERMAASFCFEDPLIKASARRRERRRQQRAAEANGEMEEAARTSSSEAESTLSGLEGRQRAASGSDRSSDSGDAVETCQTGAVHKAAAVANTVAAAAEGVEAAAAAAAAAPAPAAAPVEEAAPVPKSYAEALRLKAKAPPAIAVLAVKSAKVEGAERPTKAPATAAADKKLVAAKGKATVASAAAIKSKKASATA